MLWWSGRAAGRADFLCVVNDSMGEWIEFREIRPSSHEDMSSRSSSATARRLASVGETWSMRQIFMEKLNNVLQGRDKRLVVELKRGEVALNVPVICHVAAR